ncbi:hypothetical protein ACC792_37420, partial [Rhizobium ruizarguesonis]
AVHEGKFEAATVRAAARRILLLLERFGAFEKRPDLTEQAVDLPEDRALIRRLGAEGAVLLKNDGNQLLAAIARRAGHFEIENGIDRLGRR